MRNVLADYWYIFILCAFGLSLYLGAVVRRYALRRALLDIPNARSSHAAPIPRGGGFSIVAVFLLSTLVLFYGGYISSSIVIAMVFGGGLVAVVGFWDDHQHVPAYIRFLVQCVAALWLIIWIGGIPEIDLYLIGLIDLGYFGYFLALFFIVWLTNLNNFMDGIDGIASVEAIFVSLSAVFFCLLTDSYGFALWSGLLAASVAGFLVWNWPSAKLFMGDVGSAFLGFVFGAYILVSINSSESFINLYVWLILMGVFFVDATYTLLHRFISGQCWYEAHCSHAYQIAAKRFKSHKKVLWVVVLINFLWLFPLAWCAFEFPRWGLLSLVFAYVPLVALCAILGSGTDDVRGEE